MKNTHTPTSCTATIMIKNAIALNMWISASRHRNQVILAHRFDAKPQTFLKQPSIAVKR